jgi:drug/metabolite transporter (DMT)-like permease
VTAAVFVSSAAISALLFGLATALQHVAAGRADRRPPLHPGLLRHLVTDRVWLLGGVCDAVATGLQVVALVGAPVTLVQPILVLGLPCAVLLRDLLGRRRPGWRDIAACLLCALSVAVLVILTEPRSEGGRPTTGWLLVVGAALAVAAALPRTVHGHRATALVTAATAGVALGLSSVLLRVILTGLGHRDLTSLLFPFVLLLAAGALGLLASQSAFQYGALAAPLSLLTITEPVVAATTAVVLLQERLRVDGPRLPAVCLAVAVCVWAVVLLARSQAMQSAPRPT